MTARKNNAYIKGFGDRMCPYANFKNWFTKSNFLLKCSVKFEGIFPFWVLRSVKMKNFPKHTEFAFKEDYVVSKCSHLWKISLKLLLVKEGCFFLCHLDLSNVRPHGDASSAVPGELAMKNIWCKIRMLYEKVCFRQSTEFKIFHINPFLHRNKQWRTLNALFFFNLHHVITVINSISS